VGGTFSFCLEEHDFSMFFALGFSDVRRFCDDAEEASLKMPLRPTAAIEAGPRGLAQHVSIRPFGSCIFFAHRRHVPSAWRQPPERLVPVRA